MRKSLFSLGVLCLASVGLAQETGYNTNWSGHRTLHVNTFANSRTATAITANVLKYPMLVRLGQADSAIFAAAKTGGADVRFTKSNNTTRLQHSIETWDATNRIGAVWVLLDTVYANSLTQNFRMHWGNAGAADSSKPNAVFDSANGFAAVWHMGNSATPTTPRPNSVAGGNPATPVNFFDSVHVFRAGLIGMADTLRSNLNVPATDEHFTLGSGYQFAQGQGTLSMWVKLLTVGSWNNFISMSSGTGIGGGQTQGGVSNNIWMGRDGSTTNFIHRTSAIHPAGNGFFATDSGVEGTARIASGALGPTNTWAHFTVTFQDTMGRHRIMYKNGEQIGNFPALASGIRANDSINARNNIRPVTRTQTFIGRSQWGDRNYRGMIDEVRISNVARNDNWIKLDFASQNPTQTLVADSTAPSIAYGVDSIVAEVGFPIQTVLPMIFTGIPHPTVAISPALPAGLTFTTSATAGLNRGMISGTPTAVAATTMHIVTATNAKGTASDTIYVTVNASTENYTTWTGMKTMTFNGAQAGIGATVTRFPFLVRLGPADSAVFAQAGAGGASLRFSRTDAIKLKYSIDHWDAVNRKAAIWVLMDQVVTGTNTLRMHWGNGTATSQSNGPGVFEASNGYVSVWHMGNPIGDSLGGARPNIAKPGTNNATPYYATTPVASMIQDGVIGKADSLRGQGNSAAGDHFHLDTSAAFSSNFADGISMSLWIKPTSYPGTSFVQWFTLGNRTTAAVCPPCAGTGDGRHSIWIGRVGSANNFVGGEALNNATSGGRIDGPTNSALLDVWQHYTMTVLGTATNGQKLYRNGQLIAQRTSTQALQTVHRNANFLGRATWNDPTSTGLFDEARVSNVIRDSNWIKLEYATQQPNAMPVSNLSYAAISGAPGTAITPRSPSLTGTATSYSLSGTLPAGLSFNDTTGVISGTPTGPGMANVTVTANSGIWSTSTTVNMNFGAVDGPYATAWSGHRWVSVNASTAGVGPVTAIERHFPLLVRLGAADSAIFSASQKTGADIRFTKIGDVIRLKHEIDHWDSAARSASIWVRVDSVYGSTNGSRLRMHFGNAMVADSSQPGAVFDSSNGFVAVFHMGGPDNTSPRPNAVVGGNPATPANIAAGASTFRAGMIGYGDSLGTAGTGTAGSHFSFGPLPIGTITNGQATLSLWVKKNVFTGWRHTISIGSGAPNQNFWFGHAGDEAGALRVRTAEGTTEQQAVNASGAWVDNTWQLVHVAYNPTPTPTVIYVNGANVAEGDIGHSLANVARTSAFIGRALWTGDNKFLGVYDEVRLARVARSAAWTRLEYANQNPAQNLVALTLTQQPVVVGINTASTQLSGEVLAVKAMNKGLMFQIQSEAASKARLAIVDMQGRVVWDRTVTTGAGMNQVFWNGESNQGQGTSTGIYVVRMSLLDADGKPTHRLNKKIPLTR